MPTSPEKSDKFLILMCTLAEEGEVALQEVEEALRQGRTQVREPQVWHPSSLLADPKALMPGFYSDLKHIHLQVSKAV